MSFTQILSFYCPSKIYMGIGSHREVEEIIKSWGSDRFFLTVDGALLESEIFLNIKDILDRNGISFGIFSDIEPDPSADTVAKAFEMSRLCVEAQYNRWNPRHTTYDDFFSLFQSAFYGQSPKAKI